MVSPSLLLGLCAAALASTTDAALTTRQYQSLTSSSTGTDGGYYYSFYTNSDSVTYTNLGGGDYNVTWDGSGSFDFVAGKGWNPGSERTVTYTANYQPDGSGYFALYGWFTDPLVEYYIVESWDGYDPINSGKHLGTVESDHGTYDIVKSRRDNDPSIVGTATFDQYWSVRRTKRTNGTITTKNHFDAWKNANLTLGTFNYQILATESWDGSGEASVSIH
ncbi:xylanase G1 [Paecilomyces variotii]|uniref:Endo-1,4-beta-xylanase n=1 Tax=Byssochlamys spectabilis TaxID=264951 RepID=A0A443HIC0_BYSSP|nr:xylanase G1 [Paecilomyces variotii]KAJ9364982.1 CAZyme family GH11 [Paecilomyces variotii]KAJ9396056.1 CAZyme family GH11 [Paecilomyces variotii]RWQ91582.1 xylanase G1 [Paecilomyces variotii]